MFRKRLNHPALGHLVLPVTWKLELWVQAPLRKWFKKQQEHESTIHIRHAPSSKQFLQLQSCIVLSCRILYWWKYTEFLIAWVQLFQSIPYCGYFLCRGGRKVKAKHNPQPSRSRDSEVVESHRCWARTLTLIWEGKIPLGKTAWERLVCIKMLANSQAIAL